MEEFIVNVNSALAEEMPAVFCCCVCNATIKSDDDV